MTQNFTLKTYEELLKYFKQSHNFTLFKEYNQADEGKTILLRHDIDYSLKHAYEVAQLEANLGVKSTYFLLFSSPFYNMLDEENISLAKEIAKLGHEIGLHYDVTVMLKGNSSNPRAIFDAEINLLSNLIDHPIKSVAMHNPSISGKDIFRDSEFINTYNDQFVKDMAYFSDSCMAWRNNFVEHLEQDNFPQKLQLLIHPILWTEKELNRTEKLDHFYQLRISETEAEINVSREIWKNHSGAIEHDEREKKRQ
jgi:hypothetical protein